MMHLKLVLYLQLCFWIWKKTFDTVDHPGLIQVLALIGVRGSSLEWFSSYLNDRYQIVQNGSFLCSKKKIECRVPQGSILGPLLFIIFIDWMKHYLSEANVILFADDTLLFLAAPLLDVLYNTIHNAVSEFLTFSQQNLLTLNFSKTLFMIFSRLLSSVGNDQTMVRGDDIKKSSNNKIFGVINWWKPVVKKPFKCYSKILMMFLLMGILRRIS